MCAASYQEIDPAYLLNAQNANSISALTVIFIFTKVCITALVARASDISRLSAPVKNSYICNLNFVLSEPTCGIFLSKELTCVSPI